jgi:RNA polymerase sigma-70 factor (ECF subfamily)
VNLCRHLVRSADQVEPGEHEQLVAAERDLVAALLVALLVLGRPVVGVAVNLGDDPGPDLHVESVLAVVSGDDLDPVRPDPVAMQEPQQAALQNARVGSSDEAPLVIDTVEPESTVRDDLLRLVFTCCHPALSREAQVALALRTLAGLDIAAISRAFLVPEATMAKRLVRARRKIADAHIPYRVPSDAELPERLPGVLGVVYLIATEGHAPSHGDNVVRVDLETEALGLAGLLVELMPGEAEVISLRALLLFTAARRPARVDENGDPVLLADQDRSRWDRAAIAEGSARLADAVRWSGGVAGPYQLQAHLGACHATATRWEDTDWGRIVLLYDLLLSVTNNPVVALNRAVALGERDGAAAGLAALDAIASLSSSHLWHAARGEALRRLGRLDDAQQEVRLAITLAPTEPDRRLLTRRLT